MITTALFYLGAYAVITSPIWTWISNHAPRLWHLLSCPACAGTWYGLVTSAAMGQLFGIVPFGLPPTSAFTPLVIALASMVWTPIGFAVMYAATYARQVLDDRHRGDQV